ncbi:maleylpyruvate isomerase family mycothiol-dependent enzyme [Actinokineospora iranica]|uniref:TIGR03083 family protein n=1 Tax=Actinokineospora iranica TaxID=1271860 RepID=A0A1G6IVV5_9PSEU|nr:maleylpyruvate isomerase family mycothiol-dependent enzyme [Actinokineospora iranica]SDC10553.1 TIGR03083 family protein [Actinokineospora iranica]
MDYVRHFRREVLAFETLARGAAEDAPWVPSCPDWTVSDLVAHLGWVHRYVTHLVRERIIEPVDPAGADFLDLPADRAGWPTPERGPSRGPIPAGLIEWFAEGAAALTDLFRDRDPAERVWTWAGEREVGFWARMQTIEAAVHHWDAANALGVAKPVDTELAEDAIDHAFAVMVAARRTRGKAEPGTGERMRFRQTDGPGQWTLCFDGDDARLIGAAEPWDVELAATASDLMLFLWHRLPVTGLGGVTGDASVLARYPALAPPI